MAAARLLEDGPLPPGPVAREVDVAARLGTVASSFTGFSIADLAKQIGSIWRDEHHLMTSPRGDAVDDAGRTQSAVRLDLVINAAFRSKGAAARTSCCLADGVG